jgi:hypothetical protein
VASFTSWTVRCTEEFPQKLRVAAVEAQITQGKLLEQLLDEKLTNGQQHSWWLQDDEPNEDVRMAGRWLAEAEDESDDQRGNTAALMSIAYSLLALAGKS